MPEVITREQLENASSDALHLEAVINGSSTYNGNGLVPARLGEVHPTLSKLFADIAASGDGGGGGTFQTNLKFTDLAALVIPGDTKIIQTCGHTVDGQGPALYYIGPSSDPAVVPSRYAANSVNNRRISLITELAVNWDQLGGDEIAFNEASVLAGSRGLPLTGTKEITITGQKDLRNIPMAIFKHPKPANNIGVTDGSGNGTILPTINFTEGGGPGVKDVKKIGPLLRIGGNPSTSFIAEKFIRFNGNFTADNPGTQAYPFICYQIEGDQSSQTTYNIGLISHRGDGLEIRNDTEKKQIQYRFGRIYDGYAIAFRHDGTASPDEVVIDANGTQCSNLVYAQEGGQYSYRINFNVENVRPWLNSAAISDFSRKSTCYAGEIRNINGEAFHIETRGTGFTSFGPNVLFDDLRIIQHFCGSILIVNPKSVSGQIFHDQVDPTRPNITTSQYRNWTSSGIDQTKFNAYAFAIGNVMENCTLRYTTRRNIARYGVRVGISDHVNPVTPNGSGFNGKKLVVDIQMGDDSHNAASFTASFAGNVMTVTAISSGSVDGGGTDPILKFIRGPGLGQEVRIKARGTGTGGTGTYILNSDVGTISSGSYQAGGEQASWFNALWLDMGNNSTVDATANLEGNVIIGPLWKNGVLEVPAQFIRDGYDVDFQAGASTEFIVHGPITMAEIASIKWDLFEGVTFLHISDFGGFSARHDGTGLFFGRPPVINKLYIDALGSDFNNAPFKTTGQMVLAQNGGATDLYIAQGPNDSDPWRLYGSNAVTPALLSQTSSFSSRVSGALSTAELKIYDGYIATLIVNGLYNSASQSTSLLKGVWFSYGTRAAAFKNLLFNSDDIYAPYNDTYFDYVPYLGWKPIPAVGGVFINIISFVIDNLPGQTDTSVSFGATVEELMTSTEYTAEGFPKTWGDTGDGSFKGVFQRSDGGNNVDIFSSSAALSYPYVPAMNYRIGIGYTSSSTHQAMRMHGGELVTGTKTYLSGGGTGDGFYGVGFFHTEYTGGGSAPDYYMRRRISQFMTGGGDWNDEKTKVYLTATDLVRKKLRRLGGLE